MGGEQLLYFPSVIHYPLYDNKTNMQYFPFKTFSMLSSLFSCIGGSFLAEYMFKSGWLQPKWDILNCVINIDSSQIVLPTDTSFNISCDTLALQRIRSTDVVSNNSNHLINGNELLPNKSSIFNVNARCDQTARSEHTALYSNGQQYNDYSTIATISQ